MISIGQFIINVLCLAGLLLGCVWFVGAVGRGWTKWSNK